MNELCIAVIKLAVKDYKKLIKKEPTKNNKKKIKELEEFLFKYNVYYHFLNIDNKYIEQRLKNDIVNNM